jgi:hypothetical protein
MAFGAAWIVSITPNRLPSIAGAIAPDTNLAGLQIEMTNALPKPILASGLGIVFCLMMLTTRRRRGNSVTASSWDAMMKYEAAVSIDPHQATGY